ncbi:MAG: GH25 family lysozyme, partial [Lachnospiraceae bacterium]|nr:GH25 family lysozyme [Lachnospiraceae bacterium]
DSIESGVPKREKRTSKSGVKRKPAKASTSRKRAPSGHKSKTPHPSRTMAKSAKKAVPVRSTGKISPAKSKVKAKPKRRRGEFESSSWDKFVHWLHGLSAMDYVIAVTGVLVIVAVVITGSIYASTKATEKKIKSFAELGLNMSDIGIAGEGTLLAMADNRVPEDVGEEEFIPSEYEEKEDEESSTVTVSMNMTSVVKDLKIKFVNKKSGKLIAGVPFKVEITGADKKTFEKTDEDKDGIIYINPMVHGEASVKMLAIDGYDKYNISSEASKINVKETLEYKKIDVADEIKSEKDVNAAAEDTAQQNQVESVLQDTVEWVESTVKSTGETTKYNEVTADKLDNLPKKTASIRINNLINQMSDLWCMRIFAEECTHQFSDWVVNKEASCSEEGSKSRVCSLCGQSETESISKIEHQWDDGVVKTEPTETAEGVKEFTCKACGATKTEPISKKEHTTHVWGEYQVVKEPTCKEEGEKKAKCTVEGCNAEDVQKIEKKPHTFKDGKCTVCGEADPNYKAPTVDLSTVLLYKGQPVYIDKEGKTKATFDHYLNKNITTFYFATTESTGKTYTGWQDIDGKTYFFDKNGNKVTGEQVIQGAKYNFGSDGVLQAGSGNLGIDVSKWNGSIDWNKVKNSGINYVIIRCGYRGSTTGALIEDPTFRKNIKGATAAGLKVGIYFFTQATNEVEAVEEASMTLSLISGYKISYPVFLDVEGSGGRGDAIDAATRTKVINAYCQTIRNSGYTPGVYANKTWLEKRFSPSAISAKIWLAQYATKPSYGGGYQMWQYTSKGKVNGIGGNVDMNLSYLGY